MSQIPIKFIEDVGVPDGLATLDPSGKIPTSQLPSTILEYQGSWNPSTNTPVLSDVTGTNGFTYRVDTTFAGPIVGLTDPSMVNFQIGNLVIYSSTAIAWQQSSAADGVVSVNGAQGAVTVNAINQLTGDVTATAASGSQSKATSLVATSNSTLTTLSALSLPGAQVTGNIAGNAANITATSNNTLTTLSSLSLPATQLSGTLQAAQFPALTGDVTTVAGALATTLATVNSNVGTFASSTVNAKGLVTAAANLSGDLTTSGSVATLATVNANTGSFGSSSVVPIITVNGKGLITAVSTSAITAANAYNYTAQTTTYSASINDWVLCSGTDFTVTLPTAVGQTGKVIVIQHNGTSLTNNYQINTTSSQTINGSNGAIASGVFVLRTASEILIAGSDGANWQVLEHQTNTGWINAGALTISASSAYVFTWTGNQNIVAGSTYTDGSGNTYTVSASTNTTTGTFFGATNPATTGTLTLATGTGVSSITWTSRTITGVPVKGTTTTDKFLWKRVGDSIIFRYVYVQSGAGTAGTGDYRFALPSGIVMDTTNINVDPLAHAGSTNVLADYLASGRTGITGSSQVGGVLFLVSPSWFGIEAMAVAVVNSANFGLNNTALRFSLYGTLGPIVGWQP